MPSVINSKISKSFELSFDQYQFLLDYFDNYEFYIGIGNSNPWNSKHGTGVNDDNPPMPMAHNINLYQPLLYKKIKFAQPAVLIKDIFLNSAGLSKSDISNLIIKRIDKDFFNLADTLLVLDKDKITEMNIDFFNNNQYNHDFTYLSYFYFEAELLPEDFEDFNFSDFRELGVFARKINAADDYHLHLLPGETIPEPQEPEARVLFKPGELSGIMSPIILQYFTPQLIESKKIFNFKFIVDIPITD